MIKITKAIDLDAEDLTELTLRSKAHWNYSQQQIEAWREELTITERYINENLIYKLTTVNQLIGFYAYRSEEKTVVKLNYLFVDPIYIGKGFGNMLMMDFLERIANSDFKRVTLDADPNAEEFYSKIGFKVVGKLKSSIKDRFLPIMELQLG